MRVATKAALRHALEITPAEAKALAFAVDHTLNDLADEDVVDMDRHPEVGHLKAVQPRLLLIWQRR